MSTETSASPARGSLAASSAGASAHDQLLLRYGSPLLLLGRILLGGIFVISGYAKLMGLSAFAASLESRGVPAASVMAVIGASVEFFGGLAVVLGVEVRYAALLMIAFVIVATAISHRFWEFSDVAARRTQQTQFSKNMAIIGGLVVLFVAGGGRLALERLWRRT